MKDWIPKTHCRLCLGTVLERVLTLPPTPPANELVSSPVEQELFPLDLMLCHVCGHVQLSGVVDPKRLFANYVYVSPPGMQPHWKAHAEEMIFRFDLKPGYFVCEIGSNDGSLLKEYEKRGLNVLGFEPATRIASAAREAGIPTVPKFFNAADVSRTRHANTDLIIANNVFAHIDALDEVVDGIKILLAPDGIFVFEVQYLRDLVEKRLWDVQYHEHLDFHAVRPLISFFDRHGLDLFNVERIDMHGGSIRGYVCRRNPDGSVRRPYGFKGAESPHQLVWEEKHAGVFDPETYAELQACILAQKNTLTAMIHDLTWACSNAGSEFKLVAYGCPAKFTTFAYGIGLNRDVIRYVVDDSSWKQGKLTPGLHIPVVSAERLLEDPPTHVLISAWNYARPIIDKIKVMFLEKGRIPPRCIVPLPTLKLE